MTRPTRHLIFQDRSSHISARRCFPFTASECGTALESVPAGGTRRWRYRVRVIVLVLCGKTRGNPCRTAILWLLRRFHRERRVGKGILVSTRRSGRPSIRPTPRLWCGLDVRAIFIHSTIVHLSLQVAIPGLIQLAQDSD